MISGVVWCFNGFHRLESKITPGMELFEQQYFTEQYIILTRADEGHEHSCLPSPLAPDPIRAGSIMWLLSILLQ